MSNHINEIVTTLKERDGITYREIAERCKISEQTLHSARKRKSMEAIHVDVFLKIAHGLGMTAEELFYGERADQTQIDSAEQHIVDCYRSTDARGKAAIMRTAEGEAGVERESEGNRRIG